jgi:ankyrin repeat protein
MCRHLVEHRQRTQAVSPRIKSNYADVENVDAISARINIQEGEMMNMKHLATEIHLMANQAGFGSFLVRQFEAMVEKREVSRQILMESTNHAMSLELLIKDDEGKRFVIRFYDPNDTLRHVRFACHDFDALAALRMDAILPPDTIESYYPGARGFSVMFVRPSEDILQAHLEVQVPISNSRRLTSGLDSLEIDGTVIFLLLEAGVTEDLLSSKVKDAISSASAAEQIKLLGTRDEDGCSGLFIAMQEGYGNAVAALSELLSLLGKEVSCNDLAMLIEARDHGGNPALWMAMRFNRPDAVREYRKLLRHIEDSIPGQVLASLLEAKGENGASGLYSALQMGHSDVIRVYGALLEAIRRKVPQTALTRLIDARKDGYPGLHAALLNGHADAIREYGRLLKDLPMNHWISLVRVTASALWAAMKGSHVDAMQAFIAICNERLDEMSANQRKDLLTAIRKSHVADDARGLFGNINYYSKFKITDPEFCDQLEDLERRLEKSQTKSGRIMNRHRGVQ